MSPLEYLPLAITSLFVIVDPIGAAPTFLAMTSRQTFQQRNEIIKLACLIAGILLLGFAWIGKWILLMLGITLPALQIAGGLVLLFVAYDMLRSQRSALQETEEEKEAGIRKEDVAITPLAIPMLSGPGAISVVILLEDKATTLLHKGILALAIVVVSFASYGLLRIAAKGDVLLGPLASRILTRLMGLFLAAVAVQFIINAVRILV